MISTGLAVQLALQWYTLQGLVLFAIADHDGAGDRFERALERDPNNIYALLYLGRVQLARRTYGAAIASLRRVIEIVPSHHHASALLADALLENGEYAAAAQAAEVAHQLRPDLDSYTLALARAYRLSGRQTRAQTLLTQLDAAGPLGLDRLMEMSAIALDLGAPDRALEHLHEAIERFPHNGKAALAHARLLYQLDRHQQALDAYRRATTLSPPEFFSFYEYATLSLEFGRSDAAYAALRQAARIDPHYPDLAPLFYSLAFAFKDAGQSDLAVDALDRAIELRPSHAEYHFQRGLLLHATGNPSGAVGALQAAAGLGADSATLHYVLASGFSVLGDDRSAIRHFERATILDPAHDYAHADLARAHLRLGHQEAAIAAFRADLARDPNVFFSHYELGLLLRRSGEHRSARRHLETALSLDPTYPHICPVLRELYADSVADSPPLPASCNPSPR